MDLVGTLERQPHRRFNPLTGQWVLVAPGRTKRPWSGNLETTPESEHLSYDPDCYLCPGNARAGGLLNPDYEASFVFTNDFASLLPEIPVVVEERHPLMRAEAGPGTCRVICFSPRHDLSLTTLGAPGILNVVDLWASQVAELAGTYQHVQVFENRGAAMGASNPHPHGQVWAGSAIPTQVIMEDTQQRLHRTSIEQPLLVEYVEVEMKEGTRVVVDNGEWLAVVPYWAAWPFETLLIPKQPVQRLPDLSAGQKQMLAVALEELLARYDNLFNLPFPYSMGWHGAPGDQPAPHWQLHAHFYPPLLGANRRKFMVGYELLAEPQRDLTPEEAADGLRATRSDRHPSMSS
jgi:UDPglucose--hexose-1-phosphate uridylyltransferase